MSMRGRDSFSDALMCVSTRDVSAYQDAVMKVHHLTRLALTGVMTPLCVVTVSMMSQCAMVSRECRCLDAWKWSNHRRAIMLSRAGISALACSSVYIIKALVIRWVSSP